MAGLVQGQGNPNNIYMVASASSLRVVDPFEQLKREVAYKIDRGLKVSTNRLIQEVQKLMKRCELSDIPFEKLLGRETLKQFECPVMLRMMHTPIECFSDEIDDMPTTISFEAFKNLTNNKNPLFPNQIIVSAKLDVRLLRNIYSALKEKESSLPPISQAQIDVLFDRLDLSSIQHFFKIEDFNGGLNEEENEMDLMANCLVLMEVLSTEQLTDLRRLHVLAEQKDFLKKILQEKHKDVVPLIEHAVQIYQYHLKQENKFRRAYSWDLENMAVILDQVQTYKASPQNLDLSVQIKLNLLKEFSCRNKLALLVSMLELFDVELPCGLSQFFSIPSQFVHIWNSLSNHPSGWDVLTHALQECMHYQITERAKVVVSEERSDKWSTEDSHSLRVFLGADIHSASYTDFWMCIKSIFDTEQKVEVLEALIGLHGLMDFEEISFLKNCVNIPQFVACLKNLLDPRSPEFVTVLRTFKNYSPELMREVSPKERSPWGVTISKCLDQELLRCYREGVDVDSLMFNRIWFYFLELFDSKEKVEILLQFLEDYKLFNQLDVSKFKFLFSVATLPGGVTLLRDMLLRIHKDNIQEFLINLRACIQACVER